MLADTAGELELARIRVLVGRDFGPSDLAVIGIAEDRETRDGPVIPLGPPHKGVT
jgi:hypothetical protein